MSAGKHTEYTVYVWQKAEEKDLSEEIKLAINKQLGTSGHVNKVEEKKDE